MPSSSTVRIDLLSSFKLKISHMTGMTDSHGESTVSEIYFFDPIWKVKLGTHKCHGTESVQKKKKKLLGSGNAFMTILLYEKKT